MVLTPDQQTHLSPWGGTGRGPCPRGRSIRGDSGDRRGIRFSRPEKKKEKKKNVNVSVVTRVNGHQQGAGGQPLCWFGEAPPRQSVGRFIPPRSGEKAILLLGGEAGLFLSEDKYLFLLLLSPCCCFRVWLQKETQEKQHF